MPPEVAGESEAAEGKDDNGERGGKLGSDGDGIASDAESPAVSGKRHALQVVEGESEVSFVQAASVRMSRHRDRHCSKWRLVMMVMIRSARLPIAVRKGQCSDKSQGTGQTA